MDQWYKSNITKGILVVAEHVLAVITVVSLMWVLAYPTMLRDLFSENQAKKFEESATFSEQIQDATGNIIEGITVRDLFETDGKYDPDRVIDIQEYCETRLVKNVNQNGLAYSVGDLEKWGAASGGFAQEDVTEEDREAVIVCKKSDGTYRYFYFNEFEELINNGKLNFVITDPTDESGGVTPEQLLFSLKNGKRSQGGDIEAEFKGLLNDEGKMEYIDCWNYDGYQFRERYAPLGAANILEIANNNPTWNGRLNEIFRMLGETINDIFERADTYQTWESTWKEGDTNLSYLYVDTALKRVYTNREEFKDYSKSEENIQKISKNGKYLIVRPKLSDFKTNMEHIEASVWRDIIKYSGPAENDFVYAVGIDTKYPIQDDFYEQNSVYEKYGAHVRFVAVLGLICAVLFLAGIVWLTIIAGRNSKSEEVNLNWFDKWKTELAAAFVIFMWAIPLVFVNVSEGSYILNSLNGEMSYSDTYTKVAYGYYTIPNIVRSGIGAAYTCGVFLIGYMSLVRRIKARTVWKNSITRALGGFIKLLFVNMNFVWKTVLLFGAFSIIHWLTLLTGSSISLRWIMIMLIIELLAFVYLIRMSIGRQKVRSGIEHISAGEVNYKIPLQGLKGEHLMMAERVNSIGEGLDAALEESMKNERLKTDLITNVSHDIKTPLTSIINYIDLLKMEDLKDPRIQRYLEVLEEKAQRLKTLTEDVVEASKVSSGNITLEIMNINLVEMIQQTSGEFEEKFKAGNLEEVRSLPEEEVIIRADGRRMWRVLENIYNNAAKYAMKGTRIYADLRVQDTTVIFSLKNVSEHPLNFTADELTERFLRGDVSRSTEGSGLGLSIAKSLTIMQGGTFELYLDGDLFKVTITFPRVLKEEKNPEEGTP